jgi:hypothetical protein
MTNRARLVGSPCEAVRPERARRSTANADAGYDRADMCGEPARFIWLGLDPRHLNLTMAQRRKYIRTNLLMCVDCAFETYHTFGWQIKDGKARLERLDIVKQRLHCRDCGVTIWVAWDYTADGPSTNPGSPFRFCPQCGARAAFRLELGVDLWEVCMEDCLAKGIEMPIPVLKMLYEDWPHQDRRFYKFYDYVKYQMDVFERTGDFEMAS